MRRNLTVRYLAILLLLLISLLSACTPQPTEKKSNLTWDGTVITGLNFYQREFPRVTVHYAEPTLPEMAAHLGEKAESLLDKHKAWGRLSPGQRLDLWVVPEGQGWPNGTIHEAGTPGILALKPLTVLLSESFLAGDDWGQRLEVNGLPEAIAIALTQGAQSAAYSVKWLHDGMGRVVSKEPYQFPGGLYVRNFTGSFFLGVTPWKVDDILAAFETGEPGAKEAAERKPVMTQQEAAGAVAGLIVDRWGLNWWEYYAGKPEELTPLAAIRWATGAADDAEAKLQFTDRMKSAITMHNIVGAWPVAQNDWGSNRIKPELQQVPAAGSGVSPQSYRFDVKWDPATRTVSGDEVLVWTNGEGVNIDRLYFNLWGNYSEALWYGGNTKVESVAVNDQIVTFTARGMDLEVPLGRSVQPGERVEVRITFATRLPIAKPRFLPGQSKGQGSGEKDAEGQIALSSWYPALAQLDEKGWHLDSYPKGGTIKADPASYEVRITVPQGTRVTVPGQEAQVSEEGAQHIYQFSGKGLPEWSATLATE